LKNKLLSFIKKKLESIFHDLEIEDSSFIDLQVPPDRSKGDFSMNAAMKLAKKAKCAPAKLAAQMVEEFKQDQEWFEKIEVAGPGFINFYLKNEAVEKRFSETGIDECRQKANGGEITVIDYSSVNIAKQMHVGHLRSTIIGDVLSRVIEYLGNKVIRQNHLGDWGLPMAMVLYKAGPVLRQAEKNKQDIKKILPLERLESLYKDASAACKNDENAATEVHEILVKLQRGDSQLIDDWHKITRISMDEVYRLYKLLDVKLRQENECGESFYRSMLADTVEKIEESGHLVESEGAKCVFLDEFKGKDKSPLPLIVQKSDGGYNYGTFDLAAINYRSEELKAQRIIYVTDARQILHFRQIFAAARLCGLVKDQNIKLEHVPFGTILGEDNKPLKTRSGENVKLSKLLKEAIEKAFMVVSEKNPSLAEDYRHQVAQKVGIGAIKYADLSQNRNNDYVFSFERMLALNGNTAPYLQYAHARICSIFRKAGLDVEKFSGTATISHEAERELMLKIMEFDGVVESVAKELRPHILCNYLYELATAFSGFYDRCPVLKNDDEGLKLSRLELCSRARKTLEKGLELLGIAALKEM
jgi:arginyl-tRNA synthetase